MKQLLYLTLLVMSPLPLLAQAARGPLVGTVVDPDGKPLSGVLVDAWRAEGKGMGGLDLIYNHDFKHVAGRRTNKRGRFFLRLPFGLPTQLRIDHPPYARFVRDASLPGQGLQVKLQEPATFCGRIIRLATSALP